MEWRLKIHQQFETLSNIFKVRFMGPLGQTAPVPDQPVPITQMEPENTWPPGQAVLWDSTRPTKETTWPPGQAALTPAHKVTDSSKPVLTSVWHKQPARSVTSCDLVV